MTDPRDNFSAVDLRNFLAELIELYVEDNKEWPTYSKPVQSEDPMVGQMLVVIGGSKFKLIIQQEP